MRSKILHGSKVGTQNVRDCFAVDKVSPLSLSLAGQLEALLSSPRQDGARREIGGGGGR